MLAVLACVLLWTLAKGALLVVERLSLTDCSLVMGEGTVVKLNPVCAWGCWVVVRCEPQGDPATVTQAAMERVGGVSYP